MANELRESTSGKMVKTTAGEIRDKRPEGCAMVNAVAGLPDECVVAVQEKDLNAKGKVKGPKGNSPLEPGKPSPPEEKPKKDAE